MEVKQVTSTRQILTSSTVQSGRFPVQFDAESRCKALVSPARDCFMPTTAIYLDHNATTPVDPRVLDAMLPFFQAMFGNAASRTHCFGRDAEQAVAKARRQVATLIGADSKEIVWTSGATESNNLAIKGVLEAIPGRRGHVITQVTEHPAVLDPCEQLESWGISVTRLGVDAGGRIRLDELDRAIRPDTVLVSIMWANNETGTIQPVREVGALCRARGILFHTDATQAVGKVPVDVTEKQVDLLSLSAHKIYGPKGVGALFVRRRIPRIKLVPLLHGGGHEGGLRSGTLNVPAIVGFGAASEIAAVVQADDATRLTRLRDQFERQLLSALKHAHINGDPAHRLCQTTNIAFEYAESEAVMMAMPEVAVSSGSACTSASMKPSHVLKAMGVSDELAHSSLRFSLGRFTTEDQVQRAADQVVAAVNRLRELNPLFAANS